MPIRLFFTVACDGPDCTAQLDLVCANKIALRTAVIVAGWTTSRDWRFFCPDHSAVRSERDEKIVRLYVEDRLTLEQIGQLFGITRERVRRVLMRAGVTGWLVAKERTALRSAARDARKEAEREAVLSALPPCRVCQGPVRRLRSITCSSECAEAWNALRLHLDPEQAEAHRLQQARAVLKHAEKYSASAVALSRRIVAGDAPPRNRTWVAPNSRAAYYLRKFNLPMPVAAPRTLPAKCSRANKDGSPCSRHVPNEGDVCHIHRGVAASARRSS